MVERPPNFKRSVKQALNDWGNTTAAPGEPWLPLLLLRRQRTETAVPPNHPLPLRYWLDSILHDGLQEVARQNEELATVLNLRFLSGCSLEATAEKMAISPATTSRYQEQALTRLANILWQQEQSLRQNRRHEIEGRLEKPTYHDNKLFGVEELAGDLLALLRREDAPWLISLAGLGGIGKTSLADFVVRQVVPTFQFYDVIWLRLDHPTIHGRSRSPQQLLQTLFLQLSARVLPAQAAQWPQPEQAARLRQRLKEDRHLVVIDNLEEDADLSLLLPHLHDWANPSKFLLTTRAQPQEETAVYTRELGEISRKAAAQLMRHHAQKIGLPHHSHIGPAEIDAIYERTGGNPLAIKLVVGMLKGAPPAAAIANLQTSRTQGIQKMYRRIYRQAWRYLSEPARRLLSVMPLVSENAATAVYIQNLCGLAGDQFWPAVEELRQRSLIEVRGSLHEPLYGIHRLTATFLGSGGGGGFGDGVVDLQNRPTG
jgi:predicted DNA-binding protein (UPF0251 family)